MSSNCVWLQIIFFSCVSETTLFSFLWSLLRENGRFPKVFLKKQTQIEEQATEVDQEVITTNKDLLFRLIGSNNDLLVLNQWKGALNRIMPSLLSLLKNNVRSCTYSKGGEGRLFDIMTLGWALIWGTSLRAWALIWGNAVSYMYFFLRYLTGPEQC